VARYDADPLSDPDARWRQPPKGRSVPRAAEVGLVLEDVESGFVGEIVRIERDAVALEDRHGRVRLFTFGPGFWVDGSPIELIPPKVGRTAPARTASGSLAVAGRARVARNSRILVEGRHDAELVERVWGDDLRVEGVVVEYLGGIDDLPALVTEARPAADRRIGVLVDHLTPGTKERRLARQVMTGPTAAHVLVVGHPFVDIWQAVRPERIGRERWPVIPRNVEWKHGICAALCWPHADQADIAAAWKRILGRVRSYTDLEPALLGPVEQLIDFVTAATGDD
jgi:DUF3097, C-terminal domain/DUF3097, N-terminal domain